MRIEIGDALAGQRLDVIVSRATRLGRASARRLFAEGKVTLWQSGRRRRARKGDRGLADTALEIDVDSHDLTRADPDPSLSLRIALETDTLVVIDKPAGIASQPILPGERGTIANALVANYPQMADIGFSPREPGLCHRLDTGTSGLLLAAKTQTAFDELTAAIREGQLDKRYLLLCRGKPLSDTGLIDAALDTAGTRVRPRDGARPALTRYRVLRREQELTLVEASASPATRHQIRVHFASLGAPLLGDRTYGGDSQELASRHALHASHLGYAGGAEVAAFAVDSPLPNELRALVALSDVNTDPG